MSYLVLARKWRPQRFEDLIGQDSIVKILKNAVEQGKIAHAYVFSGPRGVGKTSSARILAKTLNCHDRKDSTPCGKCPSCVAISGGSDVDVIEIDGASNNSVDNIRDLRERVKYAASGGRYKVYIIDEVHMLSTSAFNALLKTLEEPPSHVIFIMATTESRKVPLTVMSRCQHMPFKRVSALTIRERLTHIAKAEGIGITDGALALIARAADGSIRDSLTILDQVTSFAEDVSEQEVKDLLDIADFRTLAETAEAVISGDRARILENVAGLAEWGADMRTFAKDLIKVFRDMLVLRISAKAAEALEIGSDEREVLGQLAARASEEHLCLVLNEIIKAEMEVRGAFSPRVALEMALIRVSFLSSLRAVNKAIAALSDEAAPEADEQYEPVDFSAVPKRAQKKKPDAAPEAMLPGTVDEPADIRRPNVPETDEPARPEQEPVAAPAEDRTFTGESLLHAIIESIDDPRLTCKLEKAVPSLRGDVLALTFSSSDAEICAMPFKDNPSMIEEKATLLRALPTRIEIHIKHPKESTNLKDKAKADPLVQDALDLFDGRIVNVRESRNNG